MNSLRHSTAGMLLLLAAQAIAAPTPASQAASPALPAAMPLERYKPMLEHSPFALATETAPAPAADVAGFAKDLVLTGAVRLGDGYYVTLSSRVDPNQHMGIKSGETYNGITVAGVVWSDAIGKTKVTLKCGGDFGVVTYDEALLTPPAAPQPPAPGPVPVANNGQPVLPPGVTLPNPNAPHSPGTVVNPNNPVVPPNNLPPNPRHRFIRNAPRAQ